jgi:protein-disulfide isomerase
MKNLLAIVPLAISLAWPVCAADKSKPEEPGITRQLADEILNELREIRKLLEKGAGPATTALIGSDGKVYMKLDGTQELGSKTAPLTMVEFTDYQCGFCQRFHTVTFPEIRKKYVDTGKLRFVSRDLPLSFHSNASRAAEAARCAGDQNRFWEMRDRLVANADKLAQADIEGYARDLKLDMTAFKSCVEDRKYALAVKNDSGIASALRIEGTPTFVIGKTTSEGMQGEIVTGALPLEAFEAKLNEASH